MIRPTLSRGCALPLAAAALAAIASPGLAAKSDTPGRAQPAAAASATFDLEALPARQYTGVLGKKILGPDGKELGLVVDVLVDAGNRPCAAVIDFGGFLGVGSRKIAIDWRLLRLTPEPSDWRIALDLDRAQIAAAPEYKPGEPAAKMVGPPVGGAPAAVIDPWAGSGVGSSR